MNILYLFLLFINIVLECLECEKLGFYFEMFCIKIDFGEFCYIKVVYNDLGIFIIKGYIWWIVEKKN